MDITLWAVNGGLAVAAVIYWTVALFGKNGLLALQKYARKLKCAADILGGRVKAEQRYDEVLLENNHAKKIFEAYQTEVERLSKIADAVEFCDISDYFNQSQIDRIVNRRLCDQIPGAMTALGMLGTFLGLTLGLRDFDQSTTETIVESINLMMHGMYTAFFTSIVGIVLSLLFSALYKSICNYAQNAQSDFVEQYRDKVLSDGKSDAVNQLLNYQKEQTEQLRFFAKDVSVEISGAITTAVTPMLQHMENCMEEFTDYAAKQQKEGLDKVVDYFLKSMNESLGNQFDELSTTMKALNEWQREAAESTRELTEKLCSSALNVDQVNVQLQKSIEDISAYVQKLKQYQETVSVHQAAAERQATKQQEISTLQEVCLEKLQKHNTDIQSMLEKSNEKIGLLEASISNINEIGKEQRESVIRAASKATQDITETVNQLYTVNSNYAEQIKSQTELLTSGVKNQIDEIQKCTLESMESAKRQEKVFADTVMQQSNEAVQKMLDSFKIVGETNEACTIHMKEQMNSISEAVHGQIEKIQKAEKEFTESLSQQAGDSLRKISDTVDQLSKSNRIIETATMNQTEQLSVGVQCQVDQMQKITNTYIEAMQEQSGAFESALVQQLEIVVGKLEQSYRETAEKESQRVEASYETIRNSIREIDGLTKKICRELEEAAKNFSAEAKNLDDGLETSLNRTFESFDRDLSSIAQHLSGTISEIREITEAIPKVLSESEQTHQEAMDELTSTTKQVAEKMNQTARQLDSLCNDFKKNYRKE